MAVVATDLCHLLCPSEGARLGLQASSLQKKLPHQDMTASYTADSSTHASCLVCGSNRTFSYRRPLVCSPTE